MQIKGLASLTAKLRAASLETSGSSRLPPSMSASTSASSLESDIFSHPTDISPASSPEIARRDAPLRSSTLAPKLRNLQLVAQKLPTARPPVDLGEPTPPYVPRPAQRRVALASESSASGSELDSPAHARREHRLPLPPRAKPMPVEEARSSLRIKLDRNFRDEDHDRLFERRLPAEGGATKLFLDHSNILLGLYKVRSRWSRVR